MTPELERIGRILVEAEGGHWHEWECDPSKVTYCSCGEKYPWEKDCRTANPNFAEWSEFGRLLKIARQRDIVDEIMEYKYSYIQVYKCHTPSIKIPVDGIDNIPERVATELARLIEEGK